MRNEDEVAAGHIPEPNKTANGGGYGSSASGGFTDMPVYKNAPDYGSAPTNGNPSDYGSHAPKSINTANDYTDAPGVGVKYADNYGSAPRVEVVNNNNGYGGNYVPPETDFDRFCGKYANMTFGEKFSKYWWFVLISLFLPAILSIVSGIILMCFRNKNAPKLGLDIFLLGLLSILVFA
jgi:hypothetical protein